MLMLVALPNWRDDDAQRLQDFRLRHHPVASRLAAYIAFVQHEHFMPDSEFIGHVRAVAARLQPFVFELTYALPLLWDGLGARVLLMPEQGAAALWHLYRNLYSGQLAAWLPTTGFFAPHLTVGSYSMPEQALAVSDQWNATQAPMRAEITELNVVRQQGPRLQWVAEVPLGRRVLAST